MHLIDRCACMAKSALRDGEMMSRPSFLKPVPYTVTAVPPFLGPAIGYSQRTVSTSGP